MREIKQLAMKFWKAIDEAHEDGKLRSYPLFSRFPKECCDLTCDLLAQYLSEYGIETYQMRGTYENDASRHHVWLLTYDGIVIDITGDQFKDKLLPAEQIQTVHVGTEGSLHRIFCMDRERWENTRFTDVNEFTGFEGRSSPRQQTLMDVYDIICLYL